MANQYITFPQEGDSEYTKPNKSVEPINKDSLKELYAKLDEEIAQRGGYQSIQHLSPENQGASGIDTESDKKVRVRHFVRAMETRPYIASGGQGDYQANKEEWYQKADKDKIETLIEDLHKGKTVINTGCANECTGTCKTTCGGTAAS